MRRLKPRLKEKSFATLNTESECIIRVSFRQKSLPYISMMYDAKLLGFSSQKVFLTAMMGPETNGSSVRVSFLILPRKNVTQIK